MKRSISCLAALIMFALSGCATDPQTAGYIDRQREHANQAPRAETETAEQREMRQKHSEVFGRPIKALSQSDEFVGPKLLHMAQPRFPYGATMTHAEETVQVAIVVDTTGHVSEAKVAESTNREFNEEALRAIRRWDFTPGSKNGKPVDVALTVPVTFRRP